MSQSHESAPKTYTVVEMHDGSFDYVADDELETKLEEWNANLQGNVKSVTIHSRSGLTKEEAIDAIQSVEQK